MTISEKRGMILAYHDCLSHISPEYPLHHYIRKKIDRLIEEIEDAEGFWP